MQVWFSRPFGVLRRGLSLANLQHLKHLVSFILFLREGGSWGVVESVRVLTFRCHAGWSVDGASQQGSISDSTAASLQDNAFEAYHFEGLWCPSSFRSSAQQNANAFSR